MEKKVEDLISELSEGVRTQSDLAELTRRLTKRVLETALNSELEEHLGYEKNEKSSIVRNNTRNGFSSKKLKTDLGEIDILSPRDRDSSFEPKIIKKHQTKFEGFDEKIISLYSKGMTTRDIQETIKDLYDADISHSAISSITDSVINDVVEWQNRPLDSIYPILYLDCISVKVHQDNRVINKSIYIALGVNLDGHKEVLGLWLSENEGSKFWLSVLTELQNRGLKDCYIASVDGLKGFPDAIKTVFPKTKVQLCIVHMVRNSLRYVPSKDMKAVAKNLKAIYNSTTKELAEKALDDFSKKWSAKYPSIEKSWRSNWDNIITLFDYPDEIRKIIYTTNAIESLNSVIRKAINNRKIFPNDTSALKIVYLAIINASKKWTMPLRDWKLALNRFAMEYEDRFNF
jgi:transposase-like protein